MILSRRNFLKGAAALAAFGALPKDAEAYWQSRDSNYNQSVAAGGNGLKTGLLAYWGMTNGSGTSITDLTGNGNTQTAQGGWTPTWTTGFVSGEGAIVGAGNLTKYFQSAALSGLLNAGAATITGWYKKTVAGNDCPFGPDSGASTNFAFFFDAQFSGNVLCRAENGLTAYGFAAGGNDTSKHFAAIVFDGSLAAGSRAKLYLDNTLITFTTTSGTFPTNILSTNAPFYITYSPSQNQPCPATQGSIGAWNRALTPTDLGNLWNAGAGLPYASFT